MVTKQKRIIMRNYPDIDIFSRFFQQRYLKIKYQEKYREKSRKNIERNQEKYPMKKHFRHIFKNFRNILSPPPLKNKFSKW